MSNRLNTIESKPFYAAGLLRIAANGTMQVPLQQQGYTYVRRVSQKAVVLFKHRGIAETVKLGTVIHSIYTEPGKIVDR